jgi:DNA mismatch repair protein MutL
MVARDSFPMYVLFIDLDPAQLDINVHPTKQEIKFEDEKIVYAFVQAAVKHALAQFSIAPSLDFSLNADIQQMEAVSKPVSEERIESITSSNLFKTFTQKNQAHKIEGTNRSELRNWKDFYEPLTQQLPSDLETITGNENTNGKLEYTGYSLLKEEPKLRLLSDTVLTQLHQTYIVTPTPLGFLLVHQQQAHERVLYERYSQAIHGKHMPAQQSLFPSTIQLSVSDSVLMNELLPDLKVLGYLIEPFGNNTFVVQGTPADILEGNEKMAIELLLEQYKHFSNDIKFSKREKLVRCVAKQQAIKSGKVLSQKEMTVLVEELFDCETPNVTPNGSPTYLEFKADYLERMFGK